MSKTEISPKKKEFCPKTTAPAPAQEFLDCESALQIVDLPSLQSHEPISLNKSVYAYVYVCARARMRIHLLVLFLFFWRTLMDTGAYEVLFLFLFSLVSNSLWCLICMMEFYGKGTRTVLSCIINLFQPHNSFLGEGWGDHPAPTAAGRAYLWFMGHINWVLGGQQKQWKCQGENLSRKWRYIKRTLSGDWLMCHSLSMNSEHNWDIKPWLSKWKYICVVMVVLQFLEWMLRRPKYVRREITESVNLPSVFASLSLMQWK